MHRKNILFVTNGLEPPESVRHVLQNMDVEVEVASPKSYASDLYDSQTDLVVCDIGHDLLRELPKMETKLFEDGSIAFLAVVDEDVLPDLRLPVRVTSDFVVKGASESELAARFRQILWPGEEASSSDFIHLDNMTVNLATYQVTVNGEPIDLTYLEYALFAFLITHPGKTYSRDALLRRVWGFEYYGGSRTVDVHVRRVRAKLGPELAQRLETVRGVGYLWNA